MILHTVCFDAEERIEIRFGLSSILFVELLFSKGPDRRIGVAFRGVRVEGSAVDFVAERAVVFYLRAFLGGERRWSFEIGMTLRHVSVEGFYRNALK